MTHRTHTAAPRFTAQRRRGGAAAWLLMIGLLAPAIVGCGGTSSSIRHVLLSPGKAAHRDSRLIPMAALNSAADDFGPTMPLDTTLLFFTSSRDDASGRQRILFSRMQRGGWSTPQPAVEINNSYSNGVPSITPGATMLYFAGDEYGFGDCDLYSVQVGPRGDVPADAIPWSVPSNLGMHINSVYWDSEPCIAADGTILYFSSNRPGGFGGRDIWYCRRKRDGTWEAPANAGERINSEYDEITPWLTPDGSELFFSSNGYDGFGGFDIFSARTEGGLTQVEHLDEPINSSADDICFSISANGSRAFVASDRPGGMGGFDLYEVTPVPAAMDPVLFVHGTVRDTAGHPLEATIEVSNLTADEVVGIVPTDAETGAYGLTLPRGGNYAITAVAPGHFFNTRQVIARADLEANAERTVDIRLESLAGGVLRPLVFFSRDGTNLLRESINDLERTARFLRANPDISMEVGGHVDKTGDPALAMPLSRGRARAVKSFLVANRIEATRLIVVGYGTERPIVDGSARDAGAVDSRVELRIIEHP